MVMDLLRQLRKAASGTSPQSPEPKPEVEAAPVVDRESRVKLQKARAELARVKAEAARLSAELDAARKANDALGKKADAATKSLAVAKKSSQATQVFLSRLTAVPWIGPGIDRALFDLHADQPSLATSLAFALLRDSASRREGLLSVIRIQSKRRLHDFVMDLVDHYPADAVLGDCFVEAVTAAANARPAAVVGLVEQLLAAPTTGGPERIENYRAALLAAGMIGDADLARRLLAHAPAPVEPAGPVTSYAHVLERARTWVARAGRDLGAMTRPGAVTFGVLGYKSPVKPSTNVGDHVQTIAMMGLMARSLPTDTRLAEGLGVEIFATIRTRVTRRADAPEGKVDLVWIDRDDPTTTPAGGPIWLPVNGWFMHSRRESQYDFPFADNIRPLFLGVHVNAPEMLTEEALAYFRKYGPVGARDYYTAELLMANGVEAFFSGCPTLSLDGIFGRAEASARKGRYSGVHRLLKDKRADPPVFRLHSDPAMPLRSETEGLAQAWGYLEDYATAAHVETPLLHCYLPCRALGTEVEFTNANSDKDPRFEGLVGISEEERAALIGRMTGRLEAVMDLILSGAHEAEVYAEWRRVTAEGVAAIRARREAAHPATAPVVETSLEAITTAPRGAFRAGVAQPMPAPGADMLDIVFCFDENFAAAARVTIRSIVRNSSLPLRFTVVTRGLAPEAIADLSRAFPECDFVWLDLSHQTFEVLNMLRHTTISTMDRLFLPTFMDYADRCVYLDVDVVVLGDIAELYHIDLAGKAIAGRVTIFPGWHSGRSMAGLIEKQLDAEQIRKFRRSYTLAKNLGYPCFNAGVQVLDLVKMRERNFGGVLARIVDDYGINDQYAVNLFVGGDFVHIPPEWNHFATQEWIGSPKLIHYTGYIKPWDTEYCPRAEEWRAYVEPGDGLAMTPAIQKSFFQ